MLILYVVYILIMHSNLLIRDLVIAKLSPYIQSLRELDNVQAQSQAVYYNSISGKLR